MSSEQLYSEISKCRICGSEHLDTVLTLGELAVSDFFEDPSQDSAVRAPLEIVLCNNAYGGCGLLQLRHTVSSEALYRNYWYRSGINQTMTQELCDIASAVTRCAGLEDNDYVIDIGANDGTLLRGYDVPNLKTIGFEPAQNLYAYGSQGTTKVIPDFFSSKAWKSEFGAARAKAITAIGMFYDLDNPNAFLTDVCECLDDQGVFVVQMMYMPYAIDRNAFDGICHEHLEYYTLFSLENLLVRHNLEVFDVEMRENINEGSVRFFIKKIGVNLDSTNCFDGLNRVEQLRRSENERGLDTARTYSELAKRIVSTKDKVIEFLHAEKAKGKVIHGYAASTKGNTTLQYYEITNDLLDMIADRNPDKWGKYTVASRIPVVSEEVSRAQQPDYYFVLAWHFMDEFLEREKKFLERGGKFIVPMPTFEIISQ